MGRLSLIHARDRISETALTGKLQAPFLSPENGQSRHALRTRTGSRAGDAPLAELRIPDLRAPDLRIGVISNAKAHRNLTRGTAAPEGVASVAWTTPQSQAELSGALAGFAARDIDVLVIDGGDGTVREVITAATPHFPNAFPTLAVVPSGKTNALALDLGIPSDWTIAAALEAVRDGRIKQRAPLEIWRRGSSAPDLRGFLFGAGAFVRATRLAQRVHGLGAFNGLAVGLSLFSAIAQTYFGRKGNAWREGERMLIHTADGRGAERPFYIALGSTLNRLPLGIKPFGAKRDGLKLLAIDAPPRRMLVSVPALLAGSEADWLDRAGYHRATADMLQMSLEGGFILDGEVFPGGALTLRKGAALNFAAP